MKKIDTSAPKEIGMAAGADGEEAFEEGYGKTSGLAVQAVYKGTGGKGGWNGGKGPSWSVQKYFNSGKGEKRSESCWKGTVVQNTGGKKGGKGQEKGGKGDTRVCWSCGKLGHITANCVKGSWSRSVNGVEEDKGGISEEVQEDDDESEHEQWQEVVSKTSKLKPKKVAHEA